MPALDARLSGPIYCRGIRMSKDALYERFRHRCWLLTKALESAPLEKALEAARAADEFLRGGAQVAAAPVLPIVRVAKAAVPCPVLEKAAVEPESRPVEAAACVTEELRDAKTTTDPRRSALIGDVVRYLRQRDDTVVAKGEDLFLVNGRFQMSGDDLVSRANRMRSRNEKSTFLLAPL